MELQALSLLTYGDFKDFINTRFSIEFEQNKILPAELIEATEFDNHSPLERKPFSIIFRTEQQNEYYPQATFMVEHPKKGALPMFLSPKGFDKIGMLYEAVFG